MNKNNFILAYVCIIIIGVCLLFMLSGCSRGLEKSCKTLQGINEDMPEIYSIFYSAHLEMPDKISDEELKAIQQIQEIILSLTNATCGLNETIKQNND